MEWNEESREIAKVILESLGGLEHIKSFDFSRACDPESKEERPSIWKVYLCLFCHTPVWQGTEHADEDAWKICDFHPYESALNTCDDCNVHLASMAAPASHLAYRQATATTFLLGKLLMKVKGAR